ncbi:MAG TPA: DUF433 domain-containing protein [Candidatus Angelobacter sp.]|nr:DUF433 domain-containing protein [Candidatus Angelobacter sp.]
MPTHHGSRKNESNQIKQPHFRYTSPSVTRPKYNPCETPNYSIEEGSKYLHVPESTIRYWIIGEPGAAPLTTVYSRSPLLLSFKNLVECYVLESLRHTHDIGLGRIRKDVEELRREKPSKYPLADYQLATRGRKIYLEGEGDELVSLTAGGQHAFKEILDPFLKRVDRNTRGIAERLFPFTRIEHQKSPVDAPRIVVIDPNVAFGKPVLVGSRISTSFLLSRKRGGASIRQLADDYGRTQEEIEEAIYLEEVHKAAA